MDRPMPRILVTGASGFVGYHVVAALHAAGFTVRCLVRAHSRLDLIDAFGPELARGDVTQPATLLPAVRDVDAVVHCAGLTRARRPAAFFAVNAEGTRHLCEACAQMGGRMQQLIAIGSLAALGPAAGPDAPVTEDDPPHPVGPYGRSKLAGQQLAASFRDRFPVTILLPPALYGPADVDFLTYFRFIKHGVMPCVGRQARSLSLLHAEDLARAVVLCLQNPASRQKDYLLEDGARHTWDEVAATMSRVMDRNPLTIRLPEGLAWAMAQLGGWWGTVSGRPPVLNPERMREFLHPCWVCCGRRIRDELGFVPQFDLAAGLRQTRDWYLNRGWI
jgi:nucleoside-diphosphate-sugar epimerase